MKKGLTKKASRRVFQKIVEHHDALRMVYVPSSELRVLNSESTARLDSADSSVLITRNLVKVLQVLTQNSEFRTQNLSNTTVVWKESYLGL